MMSNHIHILARKIEESISNTIKRISSRSDEYFLTALRYIHQNPVKAGIAKNIFDYRWSSYKEYIERAEIVGIDFVLDMFSSDRKKAVELFRNSNIQNNNDMCLENEEKLRYQTAK